ncbi:MAG: GntR family transcriptional regulator [Mycobacteriaceae bacterium]
MLVTVDTTLAVPLGTQIAAGIRGGLVRGEIVAGERLPSARALGASLQVNLHTVLRAYAELRDEGIIELRRGRGAVVRRNLDPEHTRVRELARAFVREARSLGLDPAALLAESGA